MHLNTKISSRIKTSLFIIFNLDTGERDRRNVIALVLHGEQIFYLAVQSPYPLTET
jgi:hypothetical protein